MCLFCKVSPSRSFTTSLLAAESLVTSPLTTIQFVGQNQSTGILCSVSVTVVVASWLMSINQSINQSIDQSISLLYLKMT